VALGVGAWQAGRRVGLPMALVATIFTDSLTIQVLFFLLCLMGVLVVFSFFVVFVSGFVLVLFLVFTSFFLSSFAFCSVF
jgi:hypothetical protein